MAKLQNDHLSIPARKLVPLLRDLTLTDETTRKARDQLLAWNYRLDADSVSAGIYETWQRRLAVNLQALMVPAEALPFIGQPSMVRIVEWLTSPGARFGSDPAKGRDELAARSFAEAVKELQNKLGSDMSKWNWGQEKYHHLIIRHPLTNDAGADAKQKLEIGPFARGGDAYTISATGNADLQTAGASFKIIVDTKDWDDSLGASNPGQSGDPASPHYRDLAEPWSRDEYHPLAYSRARVESVTESVLTLRPAPADKPAR